ncbi:hypothetical protein DL96DRAFT_1625598 [Flagelloscypha sp. PMI_526]|nr:hypothetical protein DL96DRAFT_1625598 [Flagelloscypha sp. PMI_526]
MIFSKALLLSTLSAAALGAAIPNRRDGAERQPVVGGFFKKRDLIAMIQERTVAIGYDDEDDTVHLYDDGNKFIGSLPAAEARPHLGRRERIPGDCFTLGREDLWNLPGVNHMEQIRWGMWGATRSNRFTNPDGSHPLQGLGVDHPAWFCYADEPIGHMTLDNEPTCQQIPADIDSKSNTPLGIEYTATVGTKSSISHQISNSSGIHLGKGFQTTTSISNTKSAGASASATFGVNGLFAHASATVEGHVEDSTTTENSQSASGSMDIDFNTDSGEALTKDIDNTQSLKITVPNDGQKCDTDVHITQCFGQASGTIKLIADGWVWYEYFDGAQWINDEGGADRGRTFRFGGFPLTRLSLEERTVELPLTSNINYQAFHANVDNLCKPFAGNGTKGEDDRSQDEEQDTSIEDKDENDGDSADEEQADDEDVTDESSDDDEESSGDSSGEENGEGDEDTGDEDTGDEEEGDEEEGENVSGDEQEGDDEEVTDEDSDDKDSSVENSGDDEEDTPDEDSGDGDTPDESTGDEDATTGDEDSSDETADDEDTPDETTGDDGGEEEEDEE